MSALVLNGYTVTPHQRQNRRRERPGSRSRRSITRKSLLQDMCREGFWDARDPTLHLPSDRATPSPLLRQSFDQSWEKWKAREAEQKALAEMDKTQLEQEQQRLFGGDVDDDELYAMGILYDDERAAAVPVELSAPPFVIRPARPRHVRRSSWQKLSLYLPFYELQTDAEIAPITTPPPSRQSPIQHRDDPTPVIEDVSVTPLSLPPSSALESVPESPYFLDTTQSPCIGDWTFVHAAQHTPVSTPASETETWILLSDDS